MSFLLSLNNCWSGDFCFFKESSIVFLSLFLSFYKQNTKMSFICLKQKNHAKPMAVKKGLLANIRIHVKWKVCLNVDGITVVSYIPTFSF